MPDPQRASASPRRRRSPALSAKVITVGASTTAMLGMMAGYGIAEGRADQSPTLEPVAEPGGAIDATSVAAVPTTLATPAAAPPQVIVVVVDGRTGEPFDTDALAQAAIDGELATGTTAAAASEATTVPANEPAAATASAPAPTPEPTPAASAPQPVAVAVDVPTPVPAPAPAPAAGAGTGVGTTARGIERWQLTPGSTQRRSFGPGRT